AKPDHDPGDRAVLHQLPDPHPRLEDDPRRRRTGGRRPGRAARPGRHRLARLDGRRPGARHPAGGRLRSDVQLPAVHDPAAVHLAGAHRPPPARGGERPLREALHDLPQGHLPAVDAGRGLRHAADLHPGDRRLHQRGPPRLDRDPHGRQRHPVPIPADPRLSDGRGPLLHPDGRDPLHGHLLHPQVRHGGAGLTMAFVTWLKRHLVVIAGLLTLAYLLLPNVVVTVFSFNNPKGRFNYEWQEFSTDAWRDPCGVSGMCGSLSLSLQIALWATLGATLLGTLIAFALVRYRFRARGAWRDPCGVPGMRGSPSLTLQIALWATLGATLLGTRIAFALVRYRFRARGAVNSLIFLPMAMPEVVMAASLLTLFLNMGAQLGFWTILIAHIMFCLSFVVVAVKARVMSMDPRLEQAAQDLYAGPFQTFWRITLPIAAPGIAAGALLAFALSFDDFIITNFNAGSTVTFPMFVWGSAQRGTPVQINVIGTAMFVVAVLLVLLSMAVGNRRKRQKA